MLLTCKNIDMKFGGKQVLSDVNLNIEKGKIIGFLGKNGSGKTTLIKIINGLLSPVNGEVLVNDEKVGVESKKVISYLPERTYLTMNLKVREFIDYFATFYEDFDKDKAYNLLADLKIDAEEKLSNLSKGTKEKVSLILVMSRKASLYILDEPMGGVDPATRDYILDTILNNFNDDASIIISTHLISDVEKILDEVIFIDEGKIIKHESADKLRSENNKSIDEIFREEFKC